MGSLLVLLCAATIRDRFEDPDMWWHLKSGELIWKSHHIFTTDPFSYTARGHALVAQEWMGQLSIYAAYRWAGFPGLMAWLVALTSLLVLAGFLLCSVYGRNVKVGFLGGIIVWFFSTIAFSIRPQLIGYIFLTIELLILHLGRSKNARWFLGLPLLFAVWVNCHASFFLGLLVAAITFFFSFFDFEPKWLQSGSWNGSTRRLFLIGFALSLPALFLNPGGRMQVFYPLNTVFRQPINLGNIEEWKPLGLLDPRGAGLLAILLCILLLVVLRRSKLRSDELALLALGSWLALSHTRFSVVFGILAAPILCRQLSGSWEGYEPARDRAWPNALLMGLALLGAWAAFPGPGNLERQVEEKRPVKAVAFLRNAHLAGPMLNDYQSGGYLIWALPEYPVFIDGRADVYEWSGVLGEFGDWATRRSDPRVLLEKYGIDFCLLSRIDPMVQAMPQLKGWRQVYSDSNAVVFVRTASAATIE